MLQVPDMPNQHCFDAGLTRVFIDDAVTQYDILITSPGDTDITRRANQVIDAAFKLSAIVTACVECSASGLCPNLVGLGAVRQSLL